MLKQAKVVVAQIRGRFSERVMHPVALGMASSKKIRFGEGGGVCWVGGGGWGCYRF